MKRKIFVFILRFFPKSFSHKLLYKQSLKKKLNLKEPKSLNEKIQWLILNYYGEKEAALTDKYLVKKYIENLNISDLNIPKTYFIIDDNSNIENFNFPQKYVLKCNHGSGDVFICTNKNNFDLKTALSKLRKLKKQDFSKVDLEYHYSYIKPCIMCEEYLDDKKNDRPADYKFFCYDGYVDCVMVCSDRNKGNYRDFFDKDWNHLNYSKKNKQSPELIEKPSSINKMFEIASKISTGFPFVRVDLYDINGKIYFGEMTFTPAAGVSTSYTEEGDLHLGKYIDIDKIKDNFK